MKLGRVALDGTKVKANASRHKAMSYDRMKQEEERLTQEIAKLMAQANSADAAEMSRTRRTTCVRSSRLLTSCSRTSLPQAGG